VNKIRATCILGRISNSSKNAAQDHVQSTGQQVECSAGCSGEVTVSKRSRLQEMRARHTMDAEEHALFRKAVPVSNMTGKRDFISLNVSNRICTSAIAGTLLLWQITNTVIKHDSS
jgi:ABC-type histidine transport system ATPase subunit